MNIIESFNAEFDEETSKYDSYPTSKNVLKFFPEICKAAQKIYDKWDQSNPNDDLNGGGICHLIADEICSILGRHGMTVVSQSSNYEQHVYTVGQFSDGIFIIDIPYSYYETGGGYTWKKTPGVIFAPDCLTVDRVDSDPARMDQYVEDWQEDDE